MRIHIVGIAGTFMAGIALIAREMGMEVTGCDQAIYPPMSDVLATAGIRVCEGYDTQQLDVPYDYIIIGNAFSRGHPYVEAILSKGLRYTSGPQWLSDHVLQGKHVLAVAGTHGKTSTSSLLAWLLVQAGLKPGYLIGGAALDLPSPATVGDSPFFVIEADEYDTAFFDKRSKFIHYRPRTLILNNCEFDHADIFADLAAIQTQCHHLVRTVPGDGRVIAPSNDAAIEEVLDQGCWTPIERFGLNLGDWQARGISDDGSEFTLWRQETMVGQVTWAMLGMHNVNNALAACAAAHHVGVSDAQILAGLHAFTGVKRRMEVIASTKDTTFYDDFAHHPTAIATTLQGLRARVGNARVRVMLQMGSRTMQQGIHIDSLADALSAADEVWLLTSDEMQWDPSQLMAKMAGKLSTFDHVTKMVEAQQTQPTASHVLLMSNKSFDGLREALVGLSMD